MRGGRPPKKPLPNVGGIVPLSYNHRQHDLSEATRAQLGLAPTTPSDFRNILRSLSSSLPNEVDFTLNVCGVLSAEAQSHPLSLNKAPSLLTLLLAQAGIYELSSSSIGASSSTSSASPDLDVGDIGVLVNTEEYNVKLRRNFWRFWLEATHEFPSMHEFIYPTGEDDVTVSSSPRVAPVNDEDDEKKRNDGAENDDGESMDVDVAEEEEEATAANRDAEASSIRELEAEDDIGENSMGSFGGVSSRDGVSESEAPRTNEIPTSEKEDKSKNVSSREDAWSKLKRLVPTSAELALGLARKGGARDAEMARVTQILVILRNLSFDEENKAVMTNDANCLRFLFLCIHSKYSNLMQMGLDTLANLASKFALDECGSKTTLVRTMRNILIIF